MHLISKLVKLIYRDLDEKQIIFLKLKDKQNENKSTSEKVKK